MARRSAKKREASHARILLEYLFLAVIAIVFAVAVQALLVKPYRIPSASMQDTLLIGDRVLVDRISWRFSPEPKRGDIVVFASPLSGPVLIKRIIGMPGEVIASQNGAITINGKFLPEGYVRRFAGAVEPSDPFDNGMDWSLQRPYKIPAGHYFVMGDNRTDSLDSREFGPVARSSLIGRGFARYWPLKRIGSLN